MSRAYVPADQAQRYYAERAADCERRGLPKIASDYRWMAANAATIARHHRPPDRPRSAGDNAMSDESKINPFPPHRVGLWRVRAVPYLRKDRWSSAPFGDRWRAIKARDRVTSVRPEPAS